MPYRGSRKERNGPRESEKAKKRKNDEGKVARERRRKERPLTREDEKGDEYHVRERERERDRESEKKMCVRRNRLDIGNERGGF